ncbi:TPA: hypothetical protein DCZ39_04600 [Patescibacteria group bacterium]|nr:hypothetical protein [Candidatus Gracilibacteria bacterium]
MANSAGDTTAPTVTSFTPIGGSTSVSISTTPTITFSETMNSSSITGSSVLLKKVSDGSIVTGTVSYDSGTHTVTITPTSSLSYTTQYYIVATTAVQDSSNNALASEYHGSAFTTQTEDAPVITSLYASNLVDISMTLNWITDITADTAQYKIKLKNGTYGSWITLSSGQSITGLTANKTYVVQVKFTKGANIVTDTLEFKTAKTSSGIEIHSIDRISTSGPTVGGTYANGYHFRFYVTANDLTEIELQFKFANRTNGATTMATADNTLLRVTENGTNDYSTGTTLTLADTYTTLSSDISAIDSDSNL